MKLKVGKLTIYHAHFPVDGWLPWFTPSSRLRAGFVWLVEWRRWWFFWGGP